MVKWVPAGLILIICGTLLSSGYYHFKAASVAKEKAGSASPEMSSPVNPLWRPAEFFPLMSMLTPSHATPENDRKSGAVGAGPSVSAQDRDRHRSVTSALSGGQREPVPSGEIIPTIKIVSEEGDAQSAASEKSNDGRKAENVVHP
jgi:hypothetical protein